jgi:hypothetical protein
MAGRLLGLVQLASFLDFALEGRIIDHPTEAARDILQAHDSAQKKKGRRMATPVREVMMSWRTYL